MTDKETFYTGVFREQYLDLTCALKGTGEEIVRRQRCLDGPNVLRYANDEAVIDIIRYLHGRR